LPPEELNSPGRVLEKLLGDPNAVSFVWDRDLAHNPQIRVIRVLWTD
jgi:hypothetical protein